MGVNGERPRLEQLADITAVGRFKMGEADCNSPWARLYRFGGFEFATNGVICARRRCSDVDEDLGSMFPRLKAMAETFAGIGTVGEWKRLTDAWGCFVGILPGIYTNGFGMAGVAFEIDGVRFDGQRVAEIVANGGEFWRASMKTPKGMDCLCFRRGPEEIIAGDGYTGFEAILASLSDTAGGGR